jgi:hypothetical protein
MKYYPEADDCYRHLQKKHGSFYWTSLLTFNTRTAMPVWNIK